MAILDVMGHFWLATNPGLQVAGRLIIDAMHKAQLELIDPLSFGNDDDQRYRILGNADGNLLTLDQCLKTGTQTKLSLHGSAIREKYRPSLVIDGANFEGSAVIEFDSVSVKLQYLEEWVGVTGLRAEPKWSGSDLERLTLTYVPIKNTTADTYWGSVEMGFNFSYSMDAIGPRELDENCVMTANFAERSPIEDIYRFCSNLQDLITLCVGRPTKIVDVSLKNSEMPQAMKLYYNWRGAYGQDTQKGIHPRQMLMTFHDIGGIEGISSWLGGAQKLRAVMAPLQNYWYTPNLDVETQFINLFSALEVLDREISDVRDSKGRNDPLWHRINRPIQRINHIISPIVGDTDDWTTEIRDRRNAFVHNDVPQSIDYTRIYFLTESLYFSLVMLLLLECGAPEEMLLKVQQNPRLQLAAERLKFSRTS